MTHTAKQCDVKGCVWEAKSFICLPDKDTPHVTFQKPNDTFYMCSDHASDMTNEDSMFPLITTQHAVIMCETGVYECHEGCEICNDN